MHNWIALCALFLWSSESKVPSHEGLPREGLFRFGTLHFRHDGDVGRIAFSPDGSVLAAATNQGQIVLWDTATGRWLNPLAPKWEKDFSIALDISFSPDCKLLASRWSDRTIRIFDIASRTEIRKIVLEEVSLMRGHVAFTSWGKFLVVGFVHIDPITKRLTPTLSVIDVALSKEVRRLNGFGGNVGEFVSSGDGSVIAVQSSANNSNIDIWNCTNWTKIRTIDVPKIPRVIALSTNGESIACGYENQIVVFQASNEGKSFVFMGNMGFVLDLAFAPDGKRIISAGQDGVIRFWNLEHRKEEYRINGPRQGIRSIALSRDGRVLAVGSAARVIRVWDTSSGRELFQRSEEPESEIKALAFAPDGTLLATGGSNREVNLWSVSAKRLHLALKSTNSAASIAFSPDGSLLITAWPNSNKIRVWNVGTGSIIKELNRSGAAAVFFGKKGSEIISVHYGDKTCSLVVWELSTGKARQEHTIHLAGAHASACSADTVALGASNGIIVLLSLESGKEIHRIVGHSRLITSLSFASSGHLLGSGSLDGTAKIWEVKHGKEKCSFTHQSPVTAVTFSPTGRVLVSGTSGDSAHGVRTSQMVVWEIATGEKIWQFQDELSGVTSLAFSYDGKLLASAMGNATIMLWETTSIPLETKHRRSLKPEELQRIWSDLAQGSAERAYRGIWCLASAPHNSIPFLKMHLRPVSRVDRRSVQKWIVDLESESYVVRSNAFSNLRKLPEELIGPEIRKAIEVQVDLEAKRRLEKLIGSQNEVRSPDTLRGIRAIEVLERIGCDEAMEMLLALDHGEPSALVTREAHYAIQRLTKSRKTAE